MFTRRPNRLGKFLLRRDERYPGPGTNWTTKHLAWLRALRFDDPCSHATFVDYLAAVKLLMGEAAHRAAIDDQSRAFPCYSGLICGMLAAAPSQNAPSDA